MQSVDLNSLSDSVQKLIESAKQAQANAYAPYSNYFVGASAQDEHGNIYNGCNVENAAYTGTHAEAAAIAALVSSGGKQVSAVVCVTKDGGSPCGDCRQRTWEFAKGNKELPVYLVDELGAIKLTSIGELLPFAFEL